MPGAPAGKVVGQLKLKVLPDTSKFAADLKKFAERMERSIRIELPVSIDGTEAVTELRALKARLEAQASINDVDIPVDVDGTKARRGMLSILGQLRLMASSLPEINAGGGQIASTLGRWGSILGIVTVAILAIGPALATVVPAALGLVVGGLAVWAAWDKVSKLFATLAPQWKALKAAVGTEMVKGLQPLISAIGSKLFPVLQKGLTTMASFLNGAFKSLAQWLTSDTGLARIAKAFDAIAIATSPLFNLLTPLSRVFIELSIAAAPALKEIGTALLDVTDRFATFLQSGKATDTITQSVRDVGKILKIIGQTSADVFPAIFSAVKAAIPFFEGLGLVVSVLAKFFAPLFKLMSEHKTTMMALGVLVGALAVAFALLTSPIFFIAVALAGLVALGALLVKHWSDIKSFAITMWASIQAAVSVAWAAIKSRFTGGMAAIKSLWASGWNSVKASLASAWAGIKSKVSSGVSAVTGAISGAWNKVKSLTSSAWNAVTGLLSSAWAKARSAVSSGISKVLGLVKALPGQIKGFLTFDLSSAGRKLIESFASGIMSALNKAYDAAKKVADAIKKLVPGSPVREGPLRAFNRGVAGFKLMSMLADGITRGRSTVTSAMGNVLDRANSQVGLSGAFNPSISAGLTSQLTTQVGAIVDNTSNSPQEIFLNWATGRGVMKNIADGVLAAREFSARQDAILAGEPA